MWQRMDSFCLWICSKFYSMVTQLSAQHSWLPPSPSNPAPKGLLLTFQTAEQLSDSCYWNLNKNKTVFFAFLPNGDQVKTEPISCVCQLYSNAALPVLGWSPLRCFKEELRVGVALREDKQEVLRAGDVSPVYRGTCLALWVRWPKIKNNPSWPHYHGSGPFHSIFNLQESYLRCFKGLII